MAFFTVSQWDYAFIYSGSPLWNILPLHFAHPIILKSQGAASKKWPQSKDQIKSISVKFFVETSERFKTTPFRAFPLEA